MILSSRRGDSGQALGKLAKALTVALQRGAFVVGKRKLLQHALNTASRPSRPIPRMWATLPASDSGAAGFAFYWQ